MSGSTLLVSYTGKLAEYIREKKIWKNGSIRKWKKKREPTRKAQKLLKSQFLERAKKMLNKASYMGQDPGEVRRCHRRTVKRFLRVGVTPGMYTKRFLKRRSIPQYLRQRSAVLHISEKKYGCHRFILKCVRAIPPFRRKY